MIEIADDSVLVQETRDALNVVRQELISRQTANGHWEGCLSSSALSTATAISAMIAMLDQSANDDQIRLRRLIDRGVGYLVGQQNSDGGFGDTDRSHSNIATSYLVLAAMEMAENSIGRSLSAAAKASLHQYIEAEGGIDGLRERYGKDKTFVVPILSNLAIAGLLDWKHVPALPFEAAALPQSWYRLASMPVVSYAIPALVAIGQAKHFHCPSRLLPLRLLRRILISRTLGVLDRMQPDSGGFLEATPLTAFVMMSLASTGRGDQPVCRRGLSFLESSVREDGSWPIDTNLATWVTSLSIAALSADPEDDRHWCEPELIQWLLSCQYHVRHPFTGSDPGGWGWTNLSGAVPDGDDTPAAILALRCLQRPSENPSIEKSVSNAISTGQTWLAGLQNRDGGMPTFCRGWGKLPFDRSSTDLTAHAIRAWATDNTSAEGEQNFDKVSAKAIAFLLRSQQPNGSWLPLWFGNQDRKEEDNPFYGTAKVLMVAGSMAGTTATRWQTAREKAAEFLIVTQNPDGGWGGGASVAAAYGEPSPLNGNAAVKKFTSTIEESAQVVEALIKFKTDSQVCSELDAKQAASSSIDQAIIRGTEFLIQTTRHRLFDVPWPIGFYFAKLWYYEGLYPLIYTASALGHFLSMVDAGSRNATPNR